MVQMQAVTDSGFYLLPLERQMRIGRENYEKYAK